MKPLCRLVIALLYAVLGTSALTHTQAAEQTSHTATTTITQTPAQPSIQAGLDERLAREWGLRREEWARYRQLMQGPLGVYSPNLDPLTALGIEAPSDEERHRYAELQVRMEGRRVEKLLAYQRAYDEAWKRLYPTLKPVSLPAERPASVKKATPARLAVFIKDGCPPCDERVKRLQAAGLSFDLYMVGSRNDDRRIREWASRVGIDPVKVRARVITLNHDSGRWLSIGGQGALPAILREVNGQWARE